MAAAAPDDPHRGDHTVTRREAAIVLARLLEDHRCAEPVVLGMEEVSDVAGFFVIATVMSGAHLRGVVRAITSLTASIDAWLPFRPRAKRKRPGALGWELLDCGGVFVHLMDETAREFYELERLWFNAERVSVG